MKKCVEWSIFHQSQPHEYVRGRGYTATNWSSDFNLKWSWSIASIQKKLETGSYAIG